MPGYVLKVTLENTHPPVWRRVVIPERIHFGDLHEIIQTIFGWENDHLHTFITPERDMFLIPSRELDFETDYPETDFLVDDLFEHHKWLRYVYDFGDDWQHKVELEKKDPAYSLRFAEVLKARGDGFEEDSGGVFQNMGEDSCRVPFSMEKTNRELEQLTFPVRRRKKGAKDRISANREKDFWHEIDRLLSRKLGDIPELSGREGLNPDMTMEEALQELIQKEFQEGEPSFEKINKSRLYQENDSRHPLRQRQIQMISAWQEFWSSPEAENLLSPEFMGEGFPAEETGGQEERLEDGQMVLPFLSEKERKNLKKGEKKKSPRKQAGCSLQVVFTDRDCTQTMEKLPVEDLENYLRYLQREDRIGKDRTDTMNAYRQELLNRPLLLAYPLEEEELACLQLLCKGEKKSVQHPMWEECVPKAFFLGLLDLCLEGTGKNCHITITIPEETRKLFGSFTMDQVRKTNRDIKRIMGHVHDILTTYGIAELDMLTDLCQRLFEKKTDPEEIRLVIYWHGSITNELITGYFSAGNTKWVCEATRDPDEVIEVRNKLPEDWPYKTLTRDTIISGKNGYMKTSFSWPALIEFLINGLCMPESEAEDLEGDILESLVWGDPVDYIREDLQDVMLTEKLLDWVTLWRIPFSLGMECPQAGLKGFSRLEYLQKTGELPAFLLLTKGEEKKRAFTRTHLFELPLQDQLDLYRLSSIHIGKGEDALYRSLDERFARNAEVQLFLALIDLEEKRYEKAEERMQAIGKLSAGLSEDMKKQISYVKLSALDKDMAAMFGDLPRREAEKEHAYLETHPLTKEDELCFQEVLTEEAYDTFLQVYSIYKERNAQARTVTLRRVPPKVGRNDPCPCGSGKKYKNCCGR